LRSPFSDIEHKSMVMSENGQIPDASGRIVQDMELDGRRHYRALTARDPRFDGVFFVGVTSTDVYCRPICPAKTPKESNCRFFDTPQEAEQAGFRPCLRCRPELAPGSAPVDDGQRIAQVIVQRLEEGNFDEKAGLEKIADQFELSSRQIRRIVQKELGVPPIQLLLTRRLLLAKQLLTETTLSITEVAFASGFSSLRRFNDAFNTRYGMPPTRLRRKATSDADAIGGSGTLTLQLAYRPPYDWDGVLEFLRTRTLAGIEHVTDDAYARTVQFGSATGWIRVTRSDGGTGRARRPGPAGGKKHALTLELTHSLTLVLPALLGRVRALFDLDARPDVIARHLRKDARLTSAVKANPGARVPGAFNGFELGVRAILGQQVTVRAATTVAGRFVTAFGAPIVTPFAELNRLTPTPARIAAVKAGDLARLGIIVARATSIVALARAQESGALALDGAHHHPDESIKQLTALPGIGPWTAHYMAMRALRWPDAFPKEDIAVRNNLGGVTAKEAEALSESWRPWRSYAVMHIWRMGALSRATPASDRLLSRGAPERSRPVRRRQSATPRLPRT
jgi:AraC family transcriptional regulator of adaptative response / DNA-3-methyladenine glycosylase II